MTHEQVWIIAVPGIVSGRLGQTGIARNRANLGQLQFEVDVR
jgi:hypothetical protein